MVARQINKIFQNCSSLVTDKTSQNLQTNNDCVNVDIKTDHICRSHKK